MEPSGPVRAQFCDYELPYRPRYKNQPGFFQEERQLRNLCLPDKFEYLQQQKPDRDLTSGKMDN